MLASLRSGSSDRIRQSFLLLQHLKQVDAVADPANDELIKTQKGFVFVSFYAALEFTLTTAVSDFLSYIQPAALNPGKYKPSLLPTLLNREFNAVVGASKRTAWEKKLSLVERLFSNNPCTIDNDVFPAESTNISADHFAMIWRQFSIPGSPLPTGINPWTLNEIKEHRNAIAHGRETASTIGARFTLNALEDRHRSVEAICAHTVLAFEEHLANRTFEMAP